MTSLRVGSRGSILALTQTRLVVARLIELNPGLSVEEVIIKTEGDQTTTPLSESKNPGVFVSALRDALLAGEVDFVIHSMKDLPAKPYLGIVTAAVPIREDSSDVFISQSGLGLMALPFGSRVGTSSPRRAASIRRLRPDLIIDSIRGNIDSRLKKVESGEYDATLLALAGLRRINRESEITEHLDKKQFVPAPGQGALSVECRDQDLKLIEALSKLDHHVSRLVALAERSVLVGLNAGCATAIGAAAELVENRLVLVAELSVESTGESVFIKSEIVLSSEDLLDAEKLGLSVAQKLLESPIAAKASLK
jgi:hydroxymethylbilane synthase